MQPPPMPKLEQYGMAKPSPLEPPNGGSSRSVTSEPMCVEPARVLVPTDDQIAAYLLNQKKMKANKRREQMSSLVSNALPK